MIARDQRSRYLEPHHLFAGIYVGCGERITPYWENADVIEDFLDRELRVREPRYYYWIRMYRKDHRIIRRRAPQIWMLSESCRKVEELATQYATSRHRGGEDRPIVRIPEDYLLAMARAELPISEKLIASGINLLKLEQAVGMVWPH